MSVDPDLAVVVYPAEADIHFPSCFGIRDSKVFPVPPCSARKVPGAAVIRLAEGTFNTPVMRKIQLTPPGVIETGPGGITVVAPEESPVEIEITY